MRSVSRNIAYQGIFQLVKTILPFISIPIVSHSLGASAVGQYSFYNSIIQYLILMSALGIPLYGVREVSKNRDDPKQLSVLFYELELLNFFSAIIIVVLAITIGILFKYPNIYFIQVVLIIGSGVDISWLFMGVEDFSKVTVTNTLIAILFVALLYLNVHDSEDLTIYTVLMTCSTIMGQLLPWLFVKKYVLNTNVKITNIYKHIKHTYILFFPQIGILTYTVFNKVILGFFSGNIAVAVYNNSMLIVSSLVVLIGVVDTVFLPRVSHQVKINDYDIAAKNLVNILQIQAFVNIGIIFGVFAVNQKFIPWFFGRSFLQMETILPLLISSLFFITAATSLSKQFFVPTNRLTAYNAIIFFGAIVSILLNFIMIPMIGAVGAAVTTLVIEFLLWMIEIIYFYRKTQLFYNWKYLFKNVVSGLCMYLTIVFITSSWPSTMLTTFLQVLIGIIAYFSVNQILGGNIWLKRYRVIK